MRILIISFFLFSSAIGVAQTEEVNLAIQTSYSLYVSSNRSKNYGNSYNSVKGDLGINFKIKKTDLYFYLTYDFNWIAKYEGHYLGISFEQHFRSKKSSFRTYYGITILSEVNSNHNNGFITDSSFKIRDHFLTSKGYYPNYYNSSGFYYGTPLFSAFSIGVDFRLLRGLYISLELGYGLKLIRYKYLEWKDYEDYHELLKDIPMKSKMLHYVNAELGLRYEFSFGKQ